MAEPKAYEPVS